MRLGEQIAAPGCRPEPLNDARQFLVRVDQGERTDGGNSALIVELAVQVVRRDVEGLIDGDWLEPEAEARGGNIRLSF